MRDIPFRAQSGFTNHGPDEPFGKLGVLDPFRYHVWFTDFDRTEGIGTTTGNDWTITKTQAGGGNAAVALADAGGGVLQITNDDADDDNFFVQKIGESFRWAVNRKLAILTRFKVSDATQSDIAIGLQITDTSPLDVTDGIFFYKADGSAVLTARVEKNDAAAAANVLTLVDDTYVEVAIVYQGKAVVIAGVTSYPFELYSKDSDNVWRQVGTINASTEAPDDEDLTVSFGIQNGEGVAKVLSIDFILVARERP